MFVKKAAVLLITAGILSPGLSQARECKAVDVSAKSGVRHSFACCDYTQSKDLIVSADGKVLWEYPAAVTQDFWVLPNGNFLLCHVRGVQEVTKDKKVVWEYKSPDGTEVHSCQPLPNGRVMVAECGTSRIIEIDRGGTIRKELRIDTNSPTVHLQFRMARKLANGHYLVALCGDGLVREYDGDGEVVRTIKATVGVYSAVRLPNGNTLIGCGYGRKVIEVDPKDRIVWQIEENEIPGIPLVFPAGVQRLPNGNTIICNWDGGLTGKQPHVFEITRDKKVVWRFDDHNQLKAIANVYLMDGPGDVARSGILR